MHDVWCVYVHIVRNNHNSDFEKSENFGCSKKKIFSESHLDQ